MVIIIETCTRTGSLEASSLSSGNHPPWSSFLFVHSFEIIWVSLFSEWKIRNHFSSESNWFFFYIVLFMKRDWCYKNKHKIFFLRIEKYLELFSSWSKWFIPRREMCRAYPVGVQLFLPMHYFRWEQNMTLSKSHTFTWKCFIYGWMDWWTGYEKCHFIVFIKIY